MAVNLPLFKFIISLVFSMFAKPAKAEDILFELLETHPADQEIRAQGIAFYKRLLAKSDADLQAGDFSRSEVHEGIAQL